MWIYKKFVHKVSHIKSVSEGEKNYTVWQKDLHKNSTATTFTTKNYSKCSEVFEVDDCIDWTLTLVQHCKKKEMYQETKNLTQWE